MRTTLTLDKDVADRLKETAHRERRPFKHVVNDALRAGLGTKGKPAKRKKFLLRTFRSKLRAGIDENRLNQLADQLEVESFVAESIKL